MRGFQGIQWIVAKAFLSPVLLVLAVAASAQEPTRSRGDSNGDGSIDISDPIHVLNFLFAGGAPPVCTPVADANADGRLDISDPVATLNFLFAGGGELPPLGSSEMNQCGTVLRQGRLLDIFQPGHGISGQAEELSTGIIRLRDFKYDGLGDPQVVVMLTKQVFSNQGLVISGDLRRKEPYAGETLEFSLPDGASSSDYRFVEIWCDAEPVTFGYADLRPVP
jgi:electron transfer DM13